MSENHPDEGFETHRRNDPAPDAERPDWLVGAEEGAQAEEQREAPPAPHLKLVRPAQGAGPAPTPGAAPKPSRPEAWKAAASSVPKLQRVEDAAAAPRRPAPPPAPKAEPAWAEPAFGATGAREPDGFSDFGGAGSDPVLDDDPLAVAPAAPAPQRPTALDEPWWTVAIDTVRTSRAMQLGVLAALLAVLAWFMWPRSQPTIAIGTIHDHPERYDGVTVRVQGKVGDVYEIGGAYAYYLQQGRDTIVVFSRVRRPYRNEKVHVAGSVSMGYLDGVARPSIFEVPE